MRIYEELFIVKAGTPEEEIQALVEQLKGVISAKGGTLDKTEVWGTRKLAYRVNKHAEGIYVLLVFHADPQTVRELERRLRVNDLIVKFITVRIDEKLKKIEKRKKARDKRAARRPAPAVHAAPSAPAAAPAAPGAAPGAPAPAPAAPAVPAPGPAPAEPVPAPAEPTPEPVQE